jgi:hypothetical protein
MRMKMTTGTMAKTDKLEGTVCATLMKSKMMKGRMFMEVEVRMITRCMKTMAAREAAEGTNSNIIMTAGRSGTNTTKMTKKTRRVSRGLASLQITRKTRMTDRRMWKKTIYNV